MHCQAFMFSTLSTHDDDNADDDADDDDYDDDGNSMKAVSSWHLVR